jgi:HK97 family phage major capsid protein
MFTITTELKDWLYANKLADATGTDEYFRKQASDAITSGKLTVEDLQRLTDKARDRLKNIVADGVKQAMGDNTAPAGRKSITNPNNPDPAAVFGVSASQVRVKAAGESYLVQKSVAKHKKTERVVHDEQGRECMTASELECAKAGAFIKYMAIKGGVQIVLTEHERGLMEEMFERDTWVGLYDGAWQKNISGMKMKALLSDSLSGGTNANPEWFDQNLITFPLLTGELFPMVDLQEVPRSASVEGATVATPTAVWGTESGTAISLYDTDSMVGTFNNSVHALTIAVEVGRDYLSDAIVDVGRYIMQLMGERMSAEIEKAIALGDGTSQPTGLFTASGMNSVTTGGTWDVGDVEGLLFGIGKQYRTSRKCAFVSNDQVYSRIRGLATGITGDTRRTFGNDEESYQIFGRPWKIQQDIPNTKTLFGDLARYRLYRRLGITLEVTTAGRELQLKNAALFTARARFAGNVTDGLAFAKATDCAA